MIKDFILDSLTGIAMLLFLFFVVGCFLGLVTIGVMLYEWNPAVSLVYTVVVIGSMLGQLRD